MSEVRSKIGTVNLMREPSISEAWRKYFKTPNSLIFRFQICLW